MIELTEQQAQAPTRDEYDDSPWTDEEMALLATEAGDLLDSFGKEA